MLRWTLLIVALLSGATTKSELVVIYDSGQTRSIREWLGPLAKGPVDRSESVSAVSAESLGDATSMLPVRSPGLTPGPVETRSHELPFAQAFFLIGSDERSQQWLQHYRQRLLKLGAVGLLVQAETVVDLETIAGIADGISITPASGSDIALALGVSHYPFALSEGRIWQ